MAGHDGVWQTVGAAAKHRRIGRLVFRSTRSLAKMPFDFAVSPAVAGLTNREPIARSIALLLAGSLTLSLAGFFFLPSGKVNSFPTYVVAIGALLLVLVCPRTLRCVLRGRATALALLLLAYLVGVTYVAEGLEGTMRSARYAGLIALFLAGVMACAVEFRLFVSVLVRALVLGGLLSAAHFLVTSGLGGEGVPWGRLRTASIAASVYGYAAVLAFGLFLTEFDTTLAKLDEGSNTARAGRRWARVGWGCAAAFLAYVAVDLGDSYVTFGLLTACLVVSIAFAWTQRLTPRATFWLPVIAILMVSQIAVFNAVMDTGRSLIWQPVVEAVFAQGSWVGAGLQSEVAPIVDCTSPLRGFSDCKVDHAHSIYVSTLQHGGILGLSLLILVVVVAASDVLELPPSESRTVTLVALAYGMTVLMFDGQSIVRKIDFVWLLFWLPVALTGGLHYGTGRAD